LTAAFVTVDASPGGAAARHQPWAGVKGERLKVLGEKEKEKKKIRKLN
jgi:hypothetical protein